MAVGDAPPCFSSARRRGDSDGRPARPRRGRRSRTRAGEEVAASRTERMPRRDRTARRRGTSERLLLRLGGRGARRRTRHGAGRGAGARCEGFVQRRARQRHTHVAAHLPSLPLPKGGGGKRLRRLPLLGAQGGEGPSHRSWGGGGEGTATSPVALPDVLLRWTAAAMVDAGRRSPHLGSSAECLL